MLPGKKVFYEKMFRDPINGNSDQVRTDLQPTGVPKYSFVQNFTKCNFWAERVLLAKND